MLGLVLASMEDVLVRHLVSVCTTCYKVFGKISLMYTIETSSAILVFRATVTRYEVSKQIKISTCLWPFEDVGRSPIQSMVQPANGT